MKDDDFAIEAIRKKNGESALEQQKAFYENMYGGKTPEEIQAAAKANYDKIHNKNVNNTLEGQQFNQKYQEKIEVMKTGAKLDVPTVAFDFGKKLADKVGQAVDKVEDAVGKATATVTTGVQHIAHDLGAKVHEGLEAVGLVKDETPAKQPDKAPEKVATKDQTITREEVVDDQKKATTGGVANTHFQNDGDEKVSIKEQDKSFEAKSAYSSSFGDNAGAKGAVTAAGGAESGYSGGEQPDKGKK